MGEEVALQQQYLKAMGIEVWQRRDLPVEVPASSLSVAEVASATPLASPQSSKETSADKPVSGPAVQVVNDLFMMDWAALRSTVASCEQCSLHTTRTQTVFGIGDQQASLMVVGEAPGADEDRQGESFVGRAGQLLNEMLRAIGFKREQVYIANIIKCHPPNNRDPQAHEISCCEAYLKRQIALVKPVVILSVGHIAAQNLLKSDEPVGVLREQELYYPGTDIPLVVTFHPAYLLRSPSEKRKAWHDLQRARDIVLTKLKDGIAG